MALQSLDGTVRITVQVGGAPEAAARPDESAR
jgi:hypothetical protein